MRRAVIGLACGLAVLSLFAFDSGPQRAATAQADPQPTGNLCERLPSKLSGDWKPAESTLSLHAPASDTCLLVDAAEPYHSIRISVSILPVTAAQSAGFARIDELDQREYTKAVKVIDGGVGPDSWGVNPAVDAPWLVFHTSGRQIRLRAENPGYGTLAELRTIAHAIITLPGRLPEAPAVIERPECARGTAAAEHVLGAKAVVRRDTIVDGYLRCQWGSATRTVEARAAGVSSDEAEYFRAMKAGDTLSPAHKVSVGVDGWQDANCYLMFRAGRQSFVAVAAVPGSSMRPIPIVMLARAIAPAFGS